MKGEKYLSILSMAAMFEGLSYTQDERKLSDEEIQHRLKDLEDKKAAKQEELKRKRGLKKFHYGSTVIWAINEKVADKKACKKGYLSNA